MREQPHSAWSIISAACVLILLACGGLGLLLLLARHNAVHNHPYNPAPPVPAVTITNEGTPV